MLNKMINPDLSGKKVVVLVLVSFCWLLGATVINVPADYPTIQAGLNATTEGDSVLVATGIYYENINWPAVNGIKLIGESEETTIIDGDSLASVIRFEDLDGIIDTTTVITGFTIQNGDAHGDYIYRFGGGIYCEYSNPTLENLTISNNSASGDGGGICCVGSNPSLENLMVSNNSADYGGGIYCEYSSPTLENLTISNNSANYGGGICCWRANPNLKIITISGNSADYGGGVYICQWSSPTLENLTIENNSASSHGGGIYCDNFDPSFENITIIGNSAHYGGGIYCGLFDPSFENITIIDNSAHYGGGIYCNNSDPIFENVTITSNSADCGGGIYCNNSDPIFENVTITSNSASYGGGIFCNSSAPIFENVTITSNSADCGGGIYCGSSDPSLVNCILWNDSPQEIYFGENDAESSITIAYSDIQGGEEGIATNGNGTVYWLDGNIDADPLFVDAENGDYTLQQNSPCIDAGAAYFEWDGEVWVDMAEDEYYGIAPDMGCYEWEGVNTEDYELPVNNCQLTNQPNPFSNETTISFSLNTENTENAKIEIYNIRGQKVKTLFSGLVKSGQHEMVWNGTDANDKAVSSGVYFYKLKIGNKELTHKMMLIK